MDCKEAGPLPLGPLLPSGACAILSFEKERETDEENTNPQHQEATESTVDKDPESTHPQEEHQQKFLPLVSLQPSEGQQNNESNLKTDRLILACHPRVHCSPRQFLAVCSLSSVTILGYQRIRRSAIK